MDPHTKNSLKQINKMKSMTWEYINTNNRKKSWPNTIAWKMNKKFKGVVYGLAIMGCRAWIVLIFKAFQTLVHFYRELLQVFIKINARSFASVY